MILITTYYIPLSNKRHNEILLCLQNNVNNIYIKKIILLNDQIYDISSINDPLNKIEQIILLNLNIKNKIEKNKKNEINIEEVIKSFRLKYSDAIKYINENFKNEVCILSNSDIYFNNTLNEINRFNLQNKMFALLRYEFHDMKLFSQWNEPRCDSQDTWIFISPLNINYQLIDFQFGTPGCDNIFASIIQRETTLTVTNPCYTIESIHVHGSEFRTYNETNRIHGKYLYLYPSDINNISKQIFIDY